MALVQASETASLRSSTRSSGRSTSEDAIADTTRRAKATNSARAGISNLTTSSITTLLLGLPGRSLDGIVNREDLGEAGNFEDLQDAVLGAHQHEVSVVAAQALESSDEDTQSR